MSGEKVSVKPSKGATRAERLAAMEEKDLDEAVDLLTLPAEDDEGNREYKLKLVNVSKNRFEELVTQMKFRLSEGLGEAFYDIGIEDNGYPVGISKEDMDESLATLTRMAQELGAKANIMVRRAGVNGGDVAEVLVRQVSDNVFLDLRVAVIGNVDSGKSTLSGVLARGELDNGRGACRLHLFRHRHEVESGRTSSISTTTIAFDASGRIVNYVPETKRARAWEEIVEMASKMVQFIDLAGHERYLRTTVSGLTGHQPDYAMLLVGANMGVTRMTKEHMGIALALRLPLFVVVTKIDIAPPTVLKQTVRDVNRLLKLPGVRKMPYVVKSVDDVLTCARSFMNERLCPIFLISNVTGKNLDLLRCFLNCIPPRLDSTDDRESKCEIVIDADFHVTGVGTVATGFIKRGKVNAHTPLLLGPNSLGEFIPVQVKSLQHMRVNVSEGVAGQHISLALKRIKRSQVRKGMVLVHPTHSPRALWEFEADVVVLFHATTIRPGYQPVVHCVTVRQSVDLVAIEGKDCLRTGDHAVCRFRFLYRPEFIRLGARIIFREGRTKCAGTITFLGVRDGEAPAPPPKGAKQNPHHHAHQGDKSALKTSAPAHATAVPATKRASASAHNNGVQVAS